LHRCVEIDIGHSRCRAQRGAGAVGADQQARRCLAFGAIGIGEADALPVEIRVNQRVPEMRPHADQAAANEGDGLLRHIANRSGNLPTVPQAASDCNPGVAMAILMMRPRRWTKRGPTQSISRARFNGRRSANASTPPMTAMPARTPQNAAGDFVARAGISEAHEIAAIHRQVRAGDIAGVVGGEEGHRTGDVER